MAGPPQDYPEKTVQAYL